MALTARHVGELVQELAPRLEGKRIVAVQPHPPRELLLVLAPPGPAAEDGGEGPTHRLQLSADPLAARLHARIGRMHRHKGPAAPFYRSLARDLEGLALTRIEQVADDRIVRLTAEARDASGGENRSIVLELFGRHANVLLLDDRGRILALLDTPQPESKAAERLATGTVYAPPTGGGPRDPGPPLSESLPDPADPPDHARDLAATFPLSWRVEHALAESATLRHAARERSDLVRRLERRLKASNDLLKGLRERGAACAQAERVRQDAELLNAHQGSLPRGQREVTLPDAVDPDGAPRTIALDPGLSPRKNVEKLFARYKKLKRTEERLPDEIAMAEAQRVRTDELLERARACEEDLEASQAIEREAVEAGVLTERQAPKRPSQKEPRRPYLTFRGLRGTEIRVGRSARDNDTLTFRESRGNDLWLHTADSPGSHVILRLEKGVEPDPEELLDAAHLAVHFSPRKNASRCDVHLARRKEVKKPRKAKPGLVTLSGGRILHVRVEPGRLERLLSTRRGGTE